jgi:hypothetical protein
VAGLTRTKLESYLKDIPPREGATSLSKTYLADMTEFGVQLGYGTLGKNGSIGNGNPGDRVEVNGKFGAHALFTHPPSSGDAVVKYRLKKAAQEFRTAVALNDSARGTKSALTFRVLGDGKELWASKPVQSARVVQECAVSVAGVEVLELRVHCPGFNGDGHAVWLDPYLLTASAEAAPTPEGGDIAQRFVGDWKPATPPTDGIDSIWSFRNQKGKWNIQITYYKGKQMVGFARGLNPSFADGKLTFLGHHVQKVAPHWQDATSTLTLKGEQLEVRWSDGRFSGTLMLVRLKK